jgi:hypothetical protein
MSQRELQALFLPQNVNTVVTAVFRDMSGFAQMPSKTPPQTHKLSLFCNTKFQFQITDTLRLYTIPQSPQANLMDYS